MAFTPILNHPVVGMTATYAPQGMMPYACGPVESNTVIRQGDAVTIESAWTRDYLPNGATLFYARSHNTGHASHLIWSDLFQPHA